VLGELHRKAVIWTLMQSGEESFDDRQCLKLQACQAGDRGWIKQLL